MITHFMKERVSEQTAEFLLGIDRIHTPLLPLYFLGTNDDVCKVSLERESCPSFHLLPGPKNNTSSPRAVYASPYTDSPDHAVTFTILFYKVMGL